jgi:hypothetical protein
LSSNVNECKPLRDGLHEIKLLNATILHITDPAIARVGRCSFNQGLHSSTFRLKLERFLSDRGCV